MQYTLDILFRLILWTLFASAGVRSTNVDDFCYLLCASRNCQYNQNAQCLEEHCSDVSRNVSCADVSYPAIRHCWSQCEDNNATQSVYRFTPKVTRQMFNAARTKNGSDEVRISVNNVKANALIVMQYKKHMASKKVAEQPWKTLVANFSSGFPYTWNLPTACHSYVLRVAQMLYGTFGKWSETVVLPQQVPKSVSMSVVSREYSSSEQWPARAPFDPDSQRDGQGSITVELSFKAYIEGDITTDRYVLPTGTRSPYIQKVMCQKPDPRAITLEPKTLLYSGNGTYMMSIPSKRMKERCKYAILFDYAMDSECGDRKYSFNKPQFFDFWLNCENVVDSWKFVECGKLKPVPVCFSEHLKIPTTLESIQYTDDGKVNLDLHWQIPENDSAVSVYWKGGPRRPDVAHYQVFFGKVNTINPRLAIGDLVNNDVDVSSALNTCYDDLMIPHENLTFCENAALNISLIGLERNTSYGVFVCAIYDEEFPLDTTNDTWWLYYTQLGARTINTGLPEKPALSAAFLLVIVGGPLLFLLLTVASLSAFCVNRTRKRQHSLRDEMTQLKNNYSEWLVQSYDLWECNRNDLEIYEDDVLGRGAFGVVTKGKLLSRPRPSVAGSQSTDSSKLEELLVSYENSDVAVKRLPDYATEHETSKFLAEISLMKEISENMGFHSNIVNPLACLTSTMPFCLVMEFCSEGNLLDYVEQNTDVIEKDAKGQSWFWQEHTDTEFIGTEPSLLALIKFIDDILLAMIHISASGYVHRDLAARNILIHKAKERLIAKVGDFGMTRKIDGKDSEYIDLKGGKLPVKWMAIESLEKGEYTVSTDVWSFGVLLHEIVSLGEPPYDDVSPYKMLEHLLQGNRMPMPSLDADKRMHAIMLKCWQQRPEERPSFEELRFLITGKTDDVAGRTSLNASKTSVTDGIAEDQVSVVAANVLQRRRIDSGIDDDDLTSVRSSVDHEMSVRNGSLRGGPPATPKTPSFYMPKTFARLFE